MPSRLRRRARRPDLRARAGVLTGEAAVSSGDTAKGIVAGDLVNTASRVQSVAEPGTVSSATRRGGRARPRSSTRTPASTALKGKPEPVRLWRAERVVAAAGGALRPTGLEPPFVGRDRELRLLKELFHATRARSDARGWCRSSASPASASRGSRGSS